MTVLTPWQSEPFIIAPDNRDAPVVFDGSQSSDVDGDDLHCVWLEEGVPIPFGEGTIVTNWLEIGPHRVVLLVDDGQDVGSGATDFEVVSPSEALEEILSTLAGSGLPQKICV